MIQKILGRNKDKNVSFRPIYLENTLSKEKEVFVPVVPGKVRMYNCGPTVYDYPHIGNFRAFIFADVLRRMFEYNGYEVRQVMNLTDVGHLTSDADDGDDKVEKKALEEGKQVTDIVKESTKAFFKDLKELHSKNPETLFPKASDHIPEQIAFIKTLEEKGYTYKTKDGIYFDTSKFREYGKLGNIHIEGLKEGARVESNPEKINPTDFALWKFSGDGPKRQQEWETPWGVGFPGWHVECSAMALKHLGKRVDVHTGGIDHIPIHHNNEIAQTESATGTQFVSYWLHNAFITIEGKKISKSAGRCIYLYNITDRHIPALAYRYWVLTANYETQINFTWDALEGAQAGLHKLHRYFIELGRKNGDVNSEYQEKFNTFINDNLDTPKAIALLFDLMKDESVSKENKRATLLDFDRVLGLGFKESNKKLVENLSGEKKLSVKEMPDDIHELVKKREDARKDKDWVLADTLRENIEKQGYIVKDTDGKTEISKID